MLEIRQESDTLFAIDFDGKITAAEMERELDKLIALTADVKNGRLIYHVGQFELPELGAMMVEMRKLPQLFSLLRRFDRAAVLADAPWLRAMAEWEGVLIPGFEIKSFARKDEKQAREWLAAR
ncbi:MAG: STAS/SEC14 domain-containing protein [Nitratireductor sp.]|nr:STAS/SEC14 domain-containing protein [Nitratireductor sp.]